MVTAPIEVRFRRPRLAIMLVVLGLAWPKVVVCSVQSARQASQPMRAPTRLELITDTMERHLRHSPLRPMSTNDSLRAVAITDRLSNALHAFADTSAAVAAGYRLFPPIPGQHVAHYTNLAEARREIAKFDPTKPSSILYVREGDRMRLIGAMFIAPAESSLDELDERVPLSIARWHRHVNWCVPKPEDRNRWAEWHGGFPRFGPNSLIAVREECTAVGGNFLDALDPWMLHAHIGRGDLRSIWGAPGMDRGGQVH